MVVHVDADFLIYAVSRAGAERRKLLAHSDAGDEIQISAVAWCEFCRGPRTPEQLSVARALFLDDGIIPFSEALAAEAAEVFRRLGSPRRRAADIAIGVTAAQLEARLLSRNARDFAGIPALEVEGTLR
jgi:predicted nucleic acid-binding protein